MPQGCDLPQTDGRLAQLEEHLVYTEGVGGSSPSSPTNTQICMPGLPGAAPCYPAALGQS